MEQRRPGSGGWAFLALLLALCACGGSGAYSVSELSLKFSSLMGDGNSPPPKEFTIEVVSDEAVYFGILYDQGADSPIEKVTFDIYSGTKGLVRVYVKAATELGPGSHAGTVLIIGCVDEECTREIKDSRKVVLVTYEVRPDLHAAPDTLTFSQPQDLSVPPAQQLRIDRVAPGPLYTSWRATFHPESGGSWLRVSPDKGSELPALLRVEVQPLTQAGTYRGTLRLSVDAETRRDFSWVDIPVTYTVEESALTVTPGNPGFVVTSSSTPEQLSQSVTVGGAVSPLSWTATSGAPWLQVSPGSGSNSPPARVTLSLVPEELGRLPRGDHGTTVTFRYADASGASKELRVPVKLRTELPQIDFVAPYIALAGQSQQVILRGSGFAGFASPKVRFGTELASKVEAVSDTELRVIPPALPAGRYPVRLDVAPSMTSSRAWLVVQDVQTYSPATLPSVGSKGQLVHDAERQALYVANSTSQAIERFTYDSGTQTWSASATVAVAGLVDITLTPDGTELLALSSTTLHGIDPASFGIRWTYSRSAPPYDIREGKRLAVANDGKVLIIQGAQLLSFNLSSHEVHYPASNFFPRTGSALAASGDGSLIVLSEDSGLSVYTYTASYGQLFQRDLPGGSWSVALDRTGTRGVLGNNRVFSVSPYFAELGRLPFNLRAVLSPDGTRAWILDSSTHRLRAFDLTGPRSSSGEYPEVGTGLPVGPFSGGSPLHMALAPDANTMFFTDSQSVFVQPLSSPQAGAQ